MTELDYEQLISENDSLRRELARLKLESEERIKCENISNAAMKKALEQCHPSDEINSFLASIGQSLDVERIYIFEDDPEGEGLNNTYEWCEENVSPQIDFLQKVPFEAAAWWYEQFEKGKDIHILDLEAIRDTEPVTYSYLKPQGVHSLIAKRLVLGEHVVGFFGVDNPRLELMEDISSFLDTLSNFLSSLIQNRNIYMKSEARYVAELEQKNTALNDALHKAEEASKAKSRFLSSMSHDIRTPLNAIIGMTAIAIEYIDDRNRVEDSLKKITESGKYLLALINDILDMAKIESGKMTLFMEDVSLTQAVDSVSTITRIQAADRFQQYDVNIHDIISDHIMSDALRLNQILLNLLGNAVKYTPEKGAVCIETWQEASPKGDEYVTTHIKVTDTGIGMSSEFLKTIFESFSREDANRVQKTQGTGLGMAITKNIVSAMGGRIEVESEQGRGSTFLVSFDSQKGEQTDKALDSAETENMNLNGMHILLAEDNEINAEIAISILEMNGASVVHCEDGLSVVSRFEESEPNEYDAVLMDLRMPNLGGIDAAKRIRAMQRCDAKTIPVIAMTADAFSDDVQRCLDAGMNAHLAKPIEVEQMIKTLLKYI